MKKALKMKCRLCDENKKGLWIKQAEYWNVHVCWFQHTLGTTGIILKRHIESFADLTKEEIGELGTLLKEFQKKLEKEFGPDHFNIQMNCNWHHHLHFLLLPRYKERREFMGKDYFDNSFGEPIVYTKDEEQGDIRRALTDKLR